jgi:hypothetical protein
MYSFDEPEFSISELKDFKLDPFTHLVQSLRGFVCNASMLVAGYHHYFSSEYQNFENAKNLSNIEYASAYYKYHAFQCDIVLRLRKACEPNKKSLAAGAISELLKDQSHIEQLKDYVVKSGREVMPTFDNYIKYIQKYCSELATPNKKVNDHSAPLLKKIALIRRMVNKAIAHITLDDYKATSHDLHDVFIAVSTIACAIQAIMGGFACPTELRVAESMACEVAYQGIPPEYKKEYIPAILAFLLVWVKQNLTSSSSGRINAPLT